MRVRILSLIVLVGSMLSLEVGAANRLSPLLNKKLAQINALMESGAWQEAKVQLLDLGENVSGPHAQGQISQRLGKIAYEQDDLVGAMEKFQYTFDLEVLETKQQDSLLHTIAQLHCALEQWRACQQKLTQWMQDVPGEVQASDYIHLAYAYSALEEWSSVVLPARQAIAMSNGRVALSWYQLLVLTLSKLEDWSEAIEAQKSLLQAYGDASMEWRRLVGLHLQIEDTQSALSTMRVAFEKGTLDQKEDYFQLSALQYQEGLPYQAGITLKQGIESGKLTKTERALSMWASSWLEAKAFAEVASVYQMMIQVQPEYRWFKQLASLYFQENEWELAVQIIEQALSSKQLNGLNPESGAELYLMQAIALIHLHDYERASEILVELKRKESISKRVENWMRFLEQSKSLS